MNYVIADIHGDYEKYKKILEVIKFSDVDNLYVLGDVIDRGEHGVKILRDMMMRPNVFPVLGNHEYMASISIDFLLQEVTEESVENIDSEMMQGLTEWMNVGGKTTINEFYNLSMEEREDIVDYLSEFALYDIAKVNGKTFIMVHAGLANFSTHRDLDDYDVSELIFKCPDYSKVYFDDAYLVTGHLPTFAIFAQEKGLLTSEIKPSERRFEIYEKNNHIALDCGCGYGGRLGCLCLDTMEKFYV